MGFTLRSRARAVLCLVTGAGVVSLAACSLVLDSDRTQCTLDVDCLNHGLAANAVCDRGTCRAPTASNADAAPPADPEWGCIDNAPVVPVDKAAAVTVRLAFFNDVLGVARTGLPVVACEADDRVCANPLPGSAQTTNDKGEVDMPVYSGFTGFFKVSAGGDSPTLLDSYILAYPVPDKTVERERLRWGVVSKEEYEAVAAVATGGARTVDLRLGSVFFVTTNCAVKIVSGQRAEAKPVSGTTFSYYTDSAKQQPSATQQETAEDGAGGIANLVPGNVEITVRRTVKATGSLQVVGRHQIPVAASAITFAILTPN